MWCLFYFTHFAAFLQGKTHKLVILSTFAVSISAVIWYGLKMIQFVDPESVSLRGMSMTAPDPQEAAVLPAVPLPFKVSYVTNFWAQASEVESNPHRLEIRASLLANIRNACVGA